MLEILAGQVGQALGIDQSREMLALARVNLERAGLANARVRLGDMYQLPLPDAFVRRGRHSSGSALRRSAGGGDRRGGTGVAAATVSLVLVDFAPHSLEFLRDEHAHRRLGFADREIAEWCRAAGLDPAQPCPLPGDPLTVVIWTRARRGSAPGVEQSLGGLTENVSLPAS